MNSMFIDVVNRYISIQNTIFDDNFNCFDRTEVRFTRLGDMTYRGQLYSPKGNFNNLSLVLREIYEKNYKAPTHRIPQQTTLPTESRKGKILEALTVARRINPTLIGSTVAAMIRFSPPPTTPLLQVCVSSQSISTGRYRSQNRTNNLSQEDSSLSRMGSQSPRIMKIRQYMLT
jgi:hypothetical protein